MTYETSYHKSIKTSVKNRGVCVRAICDDNKNFAFVDKEEFCKKNMLCYYENNSHCIYSNSAVQPKSVNLI